MKNIIILLLFANICFGQTKRDKSSLNIFEKELYERMLKVDEERSKRVIKYLSENPRKKKSFNDINNKEYVIYDIIGGKPIYRTLDNQIAARATKTDKLGLNGSLGLDLEGENMFIAVWDGGPIQFDHVEFLNDQNLPTRVTNFENLNTNGQLDQSDHANHVTGTIIAKGNFQEAKGMAPKANAITYNFNNDDVEMVNVQNSFTNIFMSNHSYGVPVSQGSGTTLDAWIMGFYGNDARNIDDIASIYPYYLMVASAGNSGTTSYNDGLFFGLDKLTTDKVAKNNLVVANANAFFLGANQLEYPINPTSSQGPTDDLRIKPDIAGDGTDLTSPITNSSYGVLSGTSMAAPNVSGSLLLLQEYYNQLKGNFMRSSTLKGLACHTALDDVFQPGPDPLYGWGLLDSEFAAQTIFNSTNGTAILEENTLENGNSYSITFNASSGDKITATVCWTDPPGLSSIDGDLNNQTPKLINDLDLRIVKDNDTFYPWYLFFNPSFGFIGQKGDNIRDNVERVDIELPVTGTYTLTVSHKGTLVGYPANNQSQDYALILTGNNLTLSDNDVTLSDNMKLHPNPAKDYFNLNFGISNNSDITVKIYDINARLVNEKVFNNYNNSVFNERFQTADLAKGIYMVKVSNGNRTATKKLVIN